MLSGNKGEWSEIYVFLKLLAEGRLNAADANLEIIPDVYYPIIKILRQENSVCREFVVNGKINIFDENNNEILSLPISEFVNRSQQLLNKILIARGASFRIEDIESFLKSIDVNSLAANNNDKSDINIVVHDMNTGMNPKLGFSIKSMLGGNSTLFNAGKTTNFIFQILNNGELNIEEINSIIQRPKVVNRILEIKRQGYEIKFIKIQSETFYLNLQLIDSDLPIILSELLLINYSTTGISLISEALTQLKIKNPLNFDLSQEHPFYEYKIKNFLTDCALGMTPSTVWKGHYDATGGIIIVKKDGDIVCYHIYNRNEFQNYLINSTRFEQASMRRFKFGYLYTENDKVFIKLNLQVRFI